MSDRRARFVGHPDGAYLEGIPVGTDGDTRRLHVKHGDELPVEIDGLKVSADYVESLLEQEGNWAVADAKAKTPAKAEKGGDV